MNLNDTTGDMLMARFKQMDATELININSRLYYIGFKITSKVEITYVYNINKRDQYFLQRVSPYPLPKGLFTTQEEIVDFIEDDLNKFKNAALSSNFDDFIEFNTHLSEIEGDMERLFLNFNVSKIYLEAFNELLRELAHQVQLAESKSTHIMLKH